MSEEFALQPRVSVGVASASLSIATNVQLLDERQRLDGHHSALSTSPKRLADLTV
jgi:hypothetical protein